jgi:hypothetical protein
VADINNSGLATASSAEICLTDDTQYAQITIGDSGANSDQLSVNAQVLGSTPC